MILALIPIVVAAGTLIAIQWCFCQSVEYRRYLAGLIALENLKYWIPIP